jgi:cytochrome b subunit of formate dehydrogenase
MEVPHAAFVRFGIGPLFHLQRPQLAGVSRTKWPVLPRLAAIAALSVFALSGQPKPPAAPVDCLGCHEEHAKTVAASAHAPVTCAQCHTKHADYPHPEGLPKPGCIACHVSQAGDHKRSVHGEQIAAGDAAAPSCDSCHDKAHETKRTKDAAFHKSVPDTCGLCHAPVLEAYQASVHGKALAAGISEAPVCTDCHGEHSILRPKSKGSSVAPAAVSETCGRCHGDLRLSRRFGLPSDRITTFENSFHGLASRTGAQSVANCASCHGYHNILPSSDPKSTIHTANLSKTCGNCHPGAGSRFTISPIHVAEGGVEPWQTRLPRQFYLILIPLTIGLMFLHNAGDWIRKLHALRLQPAAAPALQRAEGEIRMLPLERLQHLLLALSFFALVWTGFALKYPDQIWAKPLVGLEQWMPVRGVVHRTAGVVMILVSLLHVYLLATRRDLRLHWLHLMPRWRDVTEASRMFAYNIGLSSTRPVISSHSYIEKAEYWAVVWGTGLMAVTGVLLWANNWMLAWLPKVWLDFLITVHLYEAILATLAIAVWHFYGVIFDPDVYPLDTAWLTGRTVRRHPANPLESEPPSNDSQQPGPQD